ncbi:type I pullulanase [Lewinella sp. JB7]|uniref:type I pullulanase n=1 Tax=Lewinella sp. JB7 TaxID=2962887 RepID=UPI0020C9C955|nr:type I pullulanase [Lewinella sp. JB7]MCP9235766.1 type I pullulanase [Lewinella sp. JB7]
MPTVCPTPIRPLVFVLLSILFVNCSDPRPQYNTLEDYPVYPYGDLGVAYRPAGSTFKLWSPAAQDARLRLYASDDPAAEPDEVIDLERKNGAWTATVAGDIDGTYYTFQIKMNGRWLPEATDIYATAVGTNGMRGQVVNILDTDPPGWADDRRPPFTAPTDAVIYEMHVRDFSSDPGSGITHKGKFLGLTERGTTTPAGDTTGLDYLVKLGVTHVHLLPSFDFVSVDEADTDTEQYNWGYDPQNYNVPEGSYSTDPADGKVRIREFKQMVQALHRAGIRVVMDVVYNHTGRTENSNFQLLVPDYFYRFNPDGTFSNASACGNEVASERPMVRKFIRESLEYWVDEYHVDGFRFDLMGIHDIATMNEVSASLHGIDSTILLYGEGWTAGDSPLPDSVRALKANTARLTRIAAFSDDMRDGLKGSVFEVEERGFVSGARNRAESVKFGIVGAVPHPQIAYDSVNYSRAPWARQPAQCVNYASCHDNHTLWDRLAISNAGDAPAAREQMQRLALATVLTSQGIPFLHAGTEMLRSKDGDENSYQSGDAVNAIRWDGQRRHPQTAAYVRDLIALRKAHPAFRLGSTDRIARHLTFIPTGDGQLIAYRITDAPGDQWSDIFVVLNGAAERRSVKLPEGQWRQVVDGERVVPTGITSAPESGNLAAAPRSANVLVRIAER